MIAAVVCAVGVLMFAFVPSPKAQAIGKDMFWVGLLVWLAQGAAGVPKL